MTLPRINLLLLGSGGREHALAWKISQSPRLNKLFILPGNPGTSEYGENIPGDPNNPTDVLEAVQRLQIDLVVIGPEAPLAAGVSDFLREHGARVFGPSMRAAQLETSKQFAKDFMQRQGIQTAKYAVVRDFESGVKLLETFPLPLVIKLSGLAAGKGVFLPESLAESRSILAEIFQEKRYGLAGSTVVIEEFLTGREVSLLAFTDGKSIVAMPPAQDHKRLLDGDHGPNTGGMGVFTPSPHCPPELVRRITADVLQPAIEGMRAEGTPYTGVLYAGMMLTDTGPKVLEFNCRFGDPETQAILPLLDGDLVEVMLACETETLAEIKESIAWKDEAAVCVVMAADGYPGETRKGDQIFGLESVQDGWAFHAGTSKNGEIIVTNGGRVLGLTATGANLPDAAARAYRLVEQISFAGMQFRTDIARTPSAYARAGVSITEGNRSVELIKRSVARTYRPEVLSETGAFGGLYDISSAAQMANPVLVASTDGVGTKVILAADQGSFVSIGQDIVNHCINDILVQGASPLFFLDYYASSKLSAEELAQVVEGISQACVAAGMALLGGETAEMPGVYLPGHFDLAGTIIGIVEKASILPRSDIHPGDLLVGLASSGPHTNGYSLIREVFKNTSLDERTLQDGRTLGQALLAPHRSYLPVLMPFLRLPGSPIKAMAHITGGGFVDNIPRVLPSGCGARIDTTGWQVPEIFQVIQRTGQISSTEMYHVFNMGIGMVVIISPEALDRFQSELPEETWLIGEVTSASGVALV